MRIYDIDKYKEDIDYAASLDLPWEKLNEKNVLISGATGLVGSFLIDVLMKKNTQGLSCRIYALSRDSEKAVKRFSEWEKMHELTLLSHNVNHPISLDKNIEYVLHLASNTHPYLYSTDPIGTIFTNVLGLKNMLEFASMHGCERFLFASSNEIYGENRGDTDYFSEDYCGYIDSNTLRAGYPESKRCGEALCQAFISQKKLDIVIARLTRSYGPTMLLSDTKAMSQFLKKAVAGEDIVLKSKGEQLYSYTYVCDAVSGLLTVLLYGKCGEAYNIADKASDIKLKDLAAIIAKIVGKKMIFEIPDAVESAGYSKATKALLDSSKISRLGWKAKYDIVNGIERTIDVLKNTI